jgi:hypothetical protein
VNQAHLVTFALGATGGLPEVPQLDLRVCMFCHGIDAVRRARETKSASTGEEVP